MKLKSVGELFLTRILDLNTENGNEVIIKIGKPQQFPDSPDSDYYCPYQIVGIGDEKVGYCGGVDEMQAVILSMENIGFILANTKEYKDGKLSWVCSQHGNLGFPVFDSTRILSDSGLLPDDGN